MTPACQRTLEAGVHSRTTCTRGIGLNGLFQAKHADTLGPNHRARAKTDTLGPKLQNKDQNGHFRPKSGHCDPGQAGGQCTLRPTCTRGSDLVLRPAPSGTLLTSVL